MTDFNPGPGWHKIPEYVNSSDRPKQRCILVYGPGKLALEATWLEDLPVELPTTTGAYISVRWTKEYADSREAVNCRFILERNGDWLNIDTGMIWRDYVLQRNITGFTSYYIPES